MPRLRKCFSKGGSKLTFYQNNTPIVSGLGTLSDYIALGGAPNYSDNLPPIQVYTQPSKEVELNQNLTPTVTFDFSQPPEVIKESTPVEKNVEKPTISRPTKKPSGSTGAKFTKDIYNSYYRAVRPGAASDAEARQQAQYLTQKAVFETGWGEHVANTHNYGGHRTSKGWMSFKSMDDFTKRDVQLLDKKWSNWRKAKNDAEFVNSITKNNGYGIYAPRNEYKGYFGVRNRVNRYMNKKLKYGGISRPKAWIGALIGAAASIGSSLINANSQKKQLEEQRRIEHEKLIRDSAVAQSQQMLLTQNAQRAYEEQFRMPYRLGGPKRFRSRSKVNGYDYTGVFDVGLNGRRYGRYVKDNDTIYVQNSPNPLLLFERGARRIGNERPTTDYINYQKDFDKANKDAIDSNNVGWDLTKEWFRNLRNRIGFSKGGRIRTTDGGADYYIGNGLHQVVGRDHETGGVGYNVNGEEIELENGEVWDTKNGAMRVFSDTIGIDGQSFADLAKAGFDKNKLFKIQQRMNGDSNGTYRLGGRKKFLIGGDDDLSLPNTYLTEEEARAREAAIARAYFASNPSIGNLWSGFNHWLHSIPGLLNVSGTGTQGGIAPIAGRGNVNFNIGKVQRNVQNTRNLGNQVLNATRRATPTSPVTHTPRVINVTESVADRAKSQIYPGYDWLRATPYTNNAYADAALSRGVPQSPYVEGSLDFPAWSGWRGVNLPNLTIPYNFATPAAIGTGVALASGLGYALNKVKSNNANNNNSSKVNVEGLKKSGIGVDALGASLRRRRNLSLPKVGIPEIDLSNYTFRKEPSTEVTFENIGSGNNSTGSNQSSKSGSKPNITFTPNPDNIISPEEHLFGKINGLDSSAKVTTVSKDDLAKLQANIDASTRPSIGRRNNLGMDLTTGDWIGLGANILGGGLSWLINRNALRNLQDPERPIPIQAGKLVTNFDITPQLAVNERARQASLNDVIRNTSSSVAGLDRRNLTNLNYATNAGALWADKFNREVQMLNEDTKNQQTVAMQNAALYNDYLTRRNEIRNQNRQLRAENDVALIQGLGDAVNRFIAQGQQRYEDNNALRAYIASSHNGTAEKLSMAGVDLGRRNEEAARAMADYDVNYYSKDKNSPEYKAALERQRYWTAYMNTPHRRYKRYRLFS